MGHTIYPVRISRIAVGVSSSCVADIHTIKTTTHRDRRHPHVKKKHKTENDDEPADNEFLARVNKRAGFTNKIGKPGSFAFTCHLAKCRSPPSFLIFENSKIRTEE